jgi:hypothetical protein
VALFIVIYIFVKKCLLDGAEKEGGEREDRFERMM